jgi:uncharacterized protein (TIGR02246 family)
MQETAIGAAQEEIRSLLSNYERSLNSSDAELAASCYAPDGIFMPTQAPTIEGDELQAAYAQIFETIQLRVEFTIEELEVANPTLAYALTQSRGTQTVLASEETTPEANREVFIFVRSDQGWRISRYMFNKAE